jgi:hypothetical protein
MKTVKYYAISEIEDSNQLHRTTKTKTTFIVSLQRHVTHWYEYYYGVKDKRTLTDFKEPTWLMMFLWSKIWYI